MSRCSRAVRPSDLGMVFLVRLVLDETWDAVNAAERLGRRVEDPQVLRHMAAEVRRVNLDRPSDISQRANQTLELALAADGQEA